MTARPTTPFAIAEAFAREAPFPVRVHRNAENLGFANNFLNCAAMCTGDWIAFSDQDDVWYPRKLERVTAAIETHARADLAMLCHMADVVDQNLSKTGRRLPEISHSHLKPRNSHYGFWCIGGCVMAVRADLDPRHRLARAGRATISFPGQKAPRSGFPTTNGCASWPTPWGAPSIWRKRWAAIAGTKRRSPVRTSLRPLPSGCARRR